MRLAAAFASLVILVSLAGHAVARPSVGRAGGGGNHGHAASRPQMPQARPSMPQARPQARPSMPQARPSMPNMQRPNAQTPNFQRPNVGSMQRPNMARPSLPNANAAATRPAMPTTRPAGPAQLPRPGLGTVRPAPGIPGGGGTGGGRPGGAATLPGGGFATRPTPGLRPGQIGGGQPGGGPGGNRPGGVATLPGSLPGMNTRPSPGGRPSLGGSTKPAFPRPDFPGAGGGNAGNRPGGGNRPGIGGDRPVTLPGDLANRPTGPGGQSPNRPGIGGNRPVTLPGDLANRPNRPGGQWNDRPGIGGNRPGIGDGNTFWNSGNTWINNTHNNFTNVNVGGWQNAGGWGYPGWNGGGYGGHWCNNWNNGYVNPHYGGWYNSCWSGNWGGGYGGGWWAPFALGAATWGLASTVSNWGLGYGWMGYGAGGYVNPYCSSIPATVVATSPYDYSQPVVVNNYITNDGDLTNSSDAQGGVGGTSSASATTTSPSDQAVDDALAAFKAGDYAAALSGFDKALKLAPNDSVIHEVRALALFALGRYPEAAATLNSVLAVAPGMDWTTISNVYGSVDAYTQHLRKLEDFCKSHPDDAAAHFVLAYHYLVGGHAEMAAEALKVVVAKQPGDMVAKRLLEALQPPKPAETPVPAQTESAPATAAATTAPETDLVGRWKASGGTDTVELTITAESTFTWKSTPQGKPAVELSGRIETAADAIALVSEKAGTMTGQVKSLGPDAFEFSLPGAPTGTKPLRFDRQK
ncbi:MAG: tetratricopeptide repeat protein [Pirellulales bacterium]